MKCFICNQTLEPEEKLIEHVQADINDKQYGINALTLSQLLIDINTRINKLERKA